jgi:hypothetical protein
MKSMASWAATTLKHEQQKAVMITLTFDGTPEDWTGEQCQKAFNGFMTRFKRSYWVRDYLVARELQERGVYHYHMVVLGVSYLPFSEIDAMWGHGFVWLTAYDQPARAMSYVLKYVTKGGRLHASFHLLDLLNIRKTFHEWRHMWSMNFRLHEAFVTHQISLQEFHDMFDEFVIIQSS